MLRQSSLIALAVSILLGQSAFAQDPIAPADTSPIKDSNIKVEDKNVTSGGINTTEKIDSIIAQPAAPVATDGVTPVSKHRTGFALTLSGGGARGAAHIGVLKVLEAEGLKPDFVSGNSIGAIIGSLYAAGVPAAEIERVCLSREFKKAFYPIPRKVQMFLWGTKYSMARALLIKPDIGMYSGKSIRKFIEKNLPEGVVNIEDTKIPFAMSAVNLIDTRPVWLTKGNLSQAVQASACVPFVYRPVKIDGAYLIDGGIRENLPTDMAKATGAPIVVAVKLHSYLNKVPKKDFDTTFDYADRLTSIIMAEVENKAINDADVLIAPEVQYMDMHSFDKPSMEKAIADGERAARAALPQIRKALKGESYASVNKPAEPIN